MKQLLIMAAIMLASFQVFSEDADNKSSFSKNAYGVGAIVSISTIVSFFYTSNGYPGEENETPDRKNVLIIDEEEIYEATGIIKQKLLIQFQQI